MKSAGFSFAQARSVTGWLLVAGWACLPLAGSGARAENGRSLPISLGATQTVYLDYREQNQGVDNWSLSLASQSAAFKKEPNLGLRKVVRGTMKSEQRRPVPAVHLGPGEGQALPGPQSQSGPDGRSGWRILLLGARALFEYLPVLPNVHLSFGSSGPDTPCSRTCTSTSTTSLVAVSPRGPTGPARSP